MERVLLVVIVLLVMTLGVYAMLDAWKTQRYVPLMLEFAAVVAVIYFLPRAIRRLWAQ